MRKDYTLKRLCIETFDSFYWVIRKTVKNGKESFLLLLISVSVAEIIAFKVFQRNLEKKCKKKIEHFVMSSNIPSAPTYGVYASQLIRYARCCSNYSDFLSRHRALVTRLLSQGYKVNRLSNTFKKFYGRHTDLVGQYKKNVCQMFADSIS